MASSTFTLQTSPFQIQGVSSKFLLLSCFLEISELKANNVDSDQMPHSDVGLRCLPKSLFWNARHKWVNLCICDCFCKSTYDVSTIFSHNIRTDRPEQTV